MWLTLVLLAAVAFVIKSWLWKEDRQWKLLKLFPGDRPLPCIGNALQVGFDIDTVSENLMDMWRRHGKQNFRVTIGQKHWVLLSEPADVGILLSHQTELAKPAERNAAMIPFFGHSLSTSEETRWRFFRKLMTPSFQYQTLEQKLTFLNQHNDNLMAKFDQHDGTGPVDMYRYIRPFMYDVFSSTLMGINSNLLDQPDHPYIKASEKVVRIITENYFSYWRHIEVLFKHTADYREMMDVIATIKEKSCDMLNQRKQKLKEIADEIKNNNPNVQLDVENLVKEKVKDDAYLLDELILTKLPNGEQIPDEMIVEELTLLSFTGHYTTTKTVSHTLHIIATHVDIQKKLIEEQNDIFADDISRKPTTKDLNQMKYLEAVIKETMRYIPTVTKIGRELENDLELKDGRVVPAGTSVLAYLGALFNHPETFPESDTYDPERFLQKAMPPFAFVPFSSGPRNCIGFKYAWVAMKATLSNMLRRYHFTAGGAGLEPQIKHRLITESTNGIQLRITKRKY